MSQLVGVRSVPGYISRVYGQDGDADSDVRYDVYVDSDRFSGSLENVAPIRGIQSPVELYRTARVLDPCIITLVDGSSEVRLVVFTEVFAAEEC